MSVEAQFLKKHVNQVIQERNHLKEKGQQFEHELEAGTYVKQILIYPGTIDVPKNDYISGLLAIYELNKIELMKDVFIWVYER